MHNFRRLLTKEQVFTIPNFMSFFRLVLVPFIVWICFSGEYEIGAALVLVSALTDILDGVIARKFNMVSDLGKVLDPICDKVTHAALTICLVARYSYMWIVFALLALKELTMFTLGSIAIKRRGTVQSAKWYGKLCTIVLETVMIALMLFPGLPETVAIVLLSVCCAAMVFSLLMYTVFWIRIIRSAPSESADPGNQYLEKE